MNDFLQSYLSTVNSLDRLPFFLRTLALTVVASLALRLTGLLFEDQYLLIAVMVRVGILVPYYYIVQQRLRSIGWGTNRAWLWTLGSVLPLVGIVTHLVLLFTPGKTNTDTKA